MEGITFNLSGKTAFFKKPDVNAYAYFTYNNIHKIALLGVLGAIMGLGGYNQMSTKSGDVRYPEFYERLKDIRVSIVPLSEKGYFQKKIQTFNNSVGYASKEEGKNLIVREQWLENPRWQIFILDNSIELKDIYTILKEKLMNNQCTYVPYLGKNDHMANIQNVKTIELSSIKNKDEVGHINSLFPTKAVKIEDEYTYDDENPFVFKEHLPISLNADYNFYNLEEFIFTNLEVIGINDVEDVYVYEDRVLYFI